LRSKIEQEKIMDKEYIILESIDNNSAITQRELSKKLGISLGAINILINKMVREGLIKIEKVSTNTILYMLTPKGFMEKVNKTYKYIKIHYKYIAETKDKIKQQLLRVLENEEKIIIVLGQDETGELVKTAIKEIDSPRAQLSDADDINGKTSHLVVVLDNELYEKYSMMGNRVMNILREI